METDTEDAKRAKKTWTRQSIEVVGKLIHAKKENVHPDVFDLIE